MQALESIESMFDDEPKAAPSMSGDEVIAEYIRLDKQLKATAADRQWYGSALMQQAFDERGQQKTVHLENSARTQAVACEYKTEWKVNESEMGAIRNLLGDERFDELFKVIHVPNVRALKKFLSTGSTSEQVQTAKAIIKESVTEVEKQRPTLTVEKG